MSLPAETQVLVVGAGPTGLTAAISLIHNGITPSKIIIVDGVPKGMNTSRAVAIHAATLEALDSVGCADRLVELGIKGSSWGFSDRSSRIFESSFSAISSYTKFPFTLLLSQAITEHVLEDHLKGMGVQVIRPFRATGMKSNATGHGTDVLFESGEKIWAEYVIGADGAKSVVRQLSGIGFADPDGNPMHDHPMSQMVLADVSFSQDGEPVDFNSIFGVIIAPEGMSLILPLGEPTVGKMLYDRKETIYRVGFNVPPSLGEPPSHPPLEYIQSNLDRQGPLRISSDPNVNPDPVRISKVHWSTRFRTHSAVADVFFKRVHGGIVLLVGDAAHIHSPAGGQGMNLGLRDAVGLGPVLADYIRKYQAVAGGVALAEAGEDTCFQEFAAERRKRALDNIVLTKRFMGAVGSLVRPRLFNWPVWILRILNMIPAIKKQFIWRMSGLGNK